MKMNIQIHPTFQRNLLISMCILVPSGIAAVFVVVSRSTGHEGIDLSDPINIILLAVLLLAVARVVASPFFVRCPQCKRLCKRIDSKDEVLVECPECKTKWSLAPMNFE